MVPHRGTKLVKITLGAIVLLAVSCPLAVAMYLGANESVPSSPVLALSTTVRIVSRATPLPGTTNGIHIAIPFDYCYTSVSPDCRSYYGKLSSLVGRVDLIWGATQPRVNPSIKTLYYLPFDVDAQSRGGTQDLAKNTGYEAFVSSGHADWLVFKGGVNSKGQRDCSVPPRVFDSHGNFDTLKVNQNLAWVTFSTNPQIGHIPLDITNPGVIGYEMYGAGGVPGTITPSVESVLHAGYNGIAVDSMFFTNPFNRCGVFRRVHNSWHWTPLYTAKRTYQDTVTHWLAAIYKDAKKLNRKALVAVNFDAPDVTYVRPLLPYFDVVFDERALTNYGSSYPSGYPADSDWQARMQIIETVERAGRGIILDNEIQGASENQLPERPILWTLANYLLVKRKHAYVYISFTNVSRTIQHYGRFYDRPEYHIPIGNSVDQMHQVGTSGCYARRYSGGMVFVNPTSNQTCRVNLGKPYNEVTGHAGKAITTSRVSGSIEVRPVTGLVLLSVRHGR